MPSTFVPFTTTTVASFTTTAVVALSTQVINALATWQVNALSTTQVSALTTTQLSSLNNDSNALMQATSTNVSALTTTGQIALAVSFSPPATAAIANTPKRFVASGVTTAMTALTSIANMSLLGVVPLTGGQIIAAYAQPKGTVTATSVVVAQKDQSGTLSILTSGLLTAQGPGTTTAITPLSLPNPNTGTAYSTSNYGNAQGGAELFGGLGVSQAAGVDIVVEIAALE